MTRAPRKVLGILLVVSLFVTAGVVGACNSAPAPVPAKPAPFVIGFLGPLSGDAAAFGISQRQGIELAVDEVNAKSGIWNRPVRVVFEDTQLDQNRAVAALNKVVDSDGAQVVLGDSSSANTIAIGPLAQRRSVLLLSPVASAAKVTSSGFRVFRLSPSDTFQARIGARYALDSGWKRVAVLYTNDEWGGGLGAEFARFFSENGGTITDELGAEPKTQDFRPLLTRIKSSASRDKHAPGPPDAVYIPLHPDEAIVALRQARQLGLRLAFLGADSFSEASVSKNAGQAADGVVYTVAAPANGPIFETFASAFRARFGTEPNYNAAAGYDALKVLVDASGRAGKKDVGGLTQALGLTKGYQGVSGVISFDLKGDVTSKAFEIRTLKGGVSTLVRGNVSLTQ